MMHHLVEDIMRSQQPSRNDKISQEEYLRWARGFIFDGLRSLRYGQSFCNHFGITDNILFYSRNTEEADLYIQKNYIK